MSNHDPQNGFRFGGPQGPIGGAKSQFYENREYWRILFGVITRIPSREQIIWRATVRLNPTENSEAGSEIIAEKDFISRVALTDDGHTKSLDNAYKDARTWIISTVNDILISNPDLPKRNWAEVDSCESN